MPTPAQLLGELQKIDLEMRDIGRRKNEYREKIESTEAEFKRLEGEREKLSGEVEELAGEKKKADEDIRANTERIEKDQERLGDIKNDKEYSALTKEIKNAEKTIKLKEMEAASLSEKLDAGRAGIEAAEAGIAEKEEEIKRTTAEAEASSEACEKEIKEKLEQREAAAKPISPPLLKRYETIRERRAGVAVTPIKDEACQACFMHVPPQTYLQLMKGVEEIITCPNCHRILYFDGTDAKPPDTAPPA
ncbi:MAG: C4-type zinc ribbon domain-containing protein [Thermodesulfobacteriota bacterium]